VVLLILFFSYTKTRAVGDQPGEVFAIEWKTAPGKDAQEVIGKKQSFTTEQWKELFKAAKD